MSLVPVHSPEWFASLLFWLNKPFCFDTGTVWLHWRFHSTVISPVRFPIRFLGEKKKKKKFFLFLPLKLIFQIKIKIIEWWMELGKWSKLTVYLFFQPAVASRLLMAIGDFSQPKIFGICFLFLNFLLNKIATTTTITKKKKERKRIQKYIPFECFSLAIVPLSLPR